MEDLTKMTDGDLEARMQDLRKEWNRRKATDKIESLISNVTTMYDLLVLNSKTSATLREHLERYTDDYSKAVGIGLDSLYSNVAQAKDYLYDWSWLEGGDANA